MSQGSLQNRNRVDGRTVEQIEKFDLPAGFEPYFLTDTYYHCQQVKETCEKKGFKGIAGKIKCNRIVKKVEGFKLKDIPVNGY